MLAHKSQVNSAADGPNVLELQYPIHVPIIFVSRFRGWPYTDFQRHSLASLSLNPAFRKENSRG